MPFERLLGALAFASLVPFIILYLRRPRPSDQTIPSLMFFVSERGSTRFHSFLRHLLRNLLFLLQLLILSMLAFSVMGFFLEVPAHKSGNVVIVLDVSASMQTVQDGVSRFDRALDKADEFLRGRVSIVFASNVPRVVLEGGSPDAARKILAAAEPLDTTTNLGDAILVARDLLSGKGEIVVLSDFIATEGLDPLVAKRAVSKDAVVAFHDFGGHASNVGIVSMDVSKSSAQLAVKNFNDAPEKVVIQTISNGAVQDEAAIEIPAGSLEDFTLEASPGMTEVKLVVDDDFAADNSAFVSIPRAAQTAALLITNAEDSNVEAALKAAPDITLTVARPPVVRSFDYDVIVLHEFSSELMLPGYYREVERAASNGSSVIVTAQQDLKGVGFLPVEILGVGNVSRNVVNITNYFTDGIDFGVNEMFLASKLKSGSVVVTAQDYPVLVLSQLGSGTVVYYGILDEYSSFKSSPGYPQFWSRLVRFLQKTEDLGSFNVPAGRIDVVPKQEVSTPAGKLKTDRILYDRAGFYSVGGRTVAANLLSVRESDVRSEAVFSPEKAPLLEGAGLRETRSFDVLLAVLAAVLIGLELLYIKFRGDL